MRASHVFLIEGKLCGLHTTVFLNKQKITKEMENLAGLQVSQVAIPNASKFERETSPQGTPEEVDFSSGSSILVQWAGNLFNSQVHIDPIDLLRLDERNFKIALSALKIQRYNFRASDGSSPAPR